MISYSFSYVDVGAVLNVCRGKETTKTHCLLLSLKFRSHKLFFSLVSCFDTSNLLNGSVGGVAAYTEYQKTNILWHFLSMEDFDSDSLILCPFEHLGKPVTFCNGGTSLHMTFGMHEKILILNELTTD